MADPISSRSTGGEVRQRPDERRVDVSRRLGVTIIIPLIRIPVALIRPSDDRSRENVRVRVLTVERLESAVASQRFREKRVRRERRRSVVDPLREAASESNHVRHLDRILSEYVIDLLLRYADQRVGDDDGVSAGECVFC